MSETNTAAPDGELLKAVTDIKGSIDNLAKREELAELNKGLNDLKAEFAEIKVGKPNSAKSSTGGFATIGHYAQAVMHAGTPNGQIDERLKALGFEDRADRACVIPPAFAVKYKAITGVSQSEDASVGYLVAPTFAPGITETPYTTDSLLSRVRSIPIDKGAESVTFTYVDDQNRTAGIKGGMAAYWKAEADQMSGTKPRLRQIKYEPQELYAFAYATDKSLRNAPIALGSWLQSGMKEAVDFKIGDAIVNGDGAGKPRGILNSPDKISVAKETSQGAATITHANIAKMWKRMPHWMRGNAIWLCNQDCEEALDRLAATVIKNDGTSLESADSPSVYNAEKNTIKNRPVVFCEYSPTLGTVGDFVLWAPQHYGVAIKTGQGPEMSMHLRFDYAETAFRFIFEIDGRSEFPGVFTPYKGSVTRAPIVTLDTRS